MRKLLLFLFAASSITSAALTTVSDTVIAPDASPARGTIVATMLSPCTAPGSVTIRPVPITIRLSSLGAFSQALHASDVCTEGSVAYRVRYSIYGASPSNKWEYSTYWTVPTSASPVSIETIESPTTPPAAGATLPFSSITGTATDAQIPNLNTLSTGLTASRAIVTDGSSLLAVSAVTGVELGYVSGVTSAIQTQLGGKAATSHTHAAADVVSGVLSMGRLATGTPDGTKFIRDDGVLAVPPGSADAITGASALTTASVIPRVVSTGLLGPSKLSCTGTPATCTFYDDTATTGVTRVIMRAGAGQSTGSIAEFRSAADATMSGFDPTGAYFTETAGTQPSGVGTGGFFAGTAVGYNFSSTANRDGTVDLSLKRSAAGVLKSTNGSSTDYFFLDGPNLRLSAGGTTSSFPAWKRSSAKWEARLADDSASAVIIAAPATAISEVLTRGAGTPSTDDCAKWDSSGRLVSAGAACGSGSGGTGAPYSASFTSQDPLTITAATHGLGTSCNWSYIVFTVSGSVRTEFGPSGYDCNDSTGAVTIDFVSSTSGRVVLFSGGAGNVVGPASATDNAISRYDATTGKLIQDSLITISDTGALGLPAGVKQVFAPNATTAGLNDGSYAGAPSTLANGDRWYDSTANKFKCRENAATVDCISPGGGSVISVDATGGVQTASGSPITVTGTVRGALLANSQVGITYTVLTGDRGKTLTFSNAAAIAVTLPQSGTGFENGWYTFIKNIGAGDVTVTPTISTISGAATIVMSTGESCSVASDGTNYEALCSRLLAGANIGITKTRTGFTLAVTGTVPTATALAANGANCTAGQFPLGVDAAGAVETCTALPTTIAGTAAEITASAATGPVTLSLPAILTLGGKTLSGGSPLVLEGLTVDAFETTIVVTDPTAARNFTLPNADSVAVQPDTGAANNFLTAISALGVVSKAQPAFTNISGAATDAQVPDTITVNLAATATALATTRAIYGNNFDGTAALTQIIASTYGGTGNGFTAFSGPATSEKTFTLPNASATILTTNAAVTGAQGGTNNAFMDFTGPATSLKTFTLPNASSTILTSNAAVTVAQGGTGAATLTGQLAGQGTSAIVAFPFERHYVLSGSGASGVLQDADDQPTIWTNKSGRTMTITQVWCETDSATALTMQLQRDDGTPVDMLTANLSCTSTEANTTTFVSGENAIADGSKLDFAVVAAGAAAKWVAIHMTLTY